MSTVIAAALADVRAQVWAAQVAVVRAGAATWTGGAADAAAVHRQEVLTDLRRCLDALDAADRLAEVARRAEQQCLPPRPLVHTGVAAWA
jgi:hypothetical protein